MKQLKPSAFWQIVLLLTCSWLKPSLALDLNKADTLDISYFEEDVCWSSELDGCDVVGLNAEYSLALDNYYLLGMLGHFFSKHKDDPRGDPLLNSTTIAFGVGKEFMLFQEQIDDLTLNLEGLFKLQTDDDFGNSNSNSGPELRIRLQKGFATHWQVGTELIEQRFQNCSHPDCHKQGAKKPVMQNTLGVLFISREISEKWSLTYKIFDVISLPDDDVYNGRDPDYPAQVIELNYRVE